MTVLLKKEPKPTRKSFGEILEKIGHTHPEVVVLDADLGGSTNVTKFAKTFPDRFFEMGIQEANMTGVAAGLALAGKTVFMASFACFITGRYDIIRLSVGYNDANVRIVGTHAGIATGPDGTSQMGLEDISIMRVIPGMAVVQPADDIETKKLIEYSLEHVGPMYIRLTRHAVDCVHTDDYRFEFGKVDVLREGSDVALIGSGGTVGTSLDAAEILANRGISAKVVNLHTINPIDVDGLVRVAKSVDRIVVCEDHSIIGGVAGAVAETLSEHYPTRIHRIGIPGVFGESGEPAELYRHFGLDGESIAAKVATFLEK
ncbi:MAG: transketolase family protein [Planctomycetes bacterium]|nr:transketolase family protein [Planctomycetota bacterium]